jgi:hypothetical protein
MSRQTEKFIVLDIETANDIPDTFAYDVGFIVADRNKVIYEKESYVVKDVFGENANIGNVRMLGIRDNTFSSCIGNLVYFISKLKLKNQKYSMINDNEMYQITSQTARKLNTSDSMLKNLFGYFFSE